MTTGIIASLGPSTSVTYTPASDAKLLINYTGVSATGTLTINSLVMSTSSTLVAITLFVGAGIPVTIAAGSASNIIVSALES